jgi:agmatinase
VFDFENEVTYPTAAEVKIVDAGDSDIIYADTKRSLANAEQAVRGLLDARSMLAALRREPSFQSIS